MNRLRPFFRLLLLLAASCAALPEARAGLTVAAFRCDVTPPIGHPLCGGWIKPLEAVDDPLLAKGIVLSDGKTRYVLCAVDWCLLQTGAYDLVRRSLAEAADIPESQVALHTVHQHNAPIADANAQRLLNQLPGSPPHLDLRFMEMVAQRMGAAVAEARTRLVPFTHIGCGKEKVRQFASNRRVRLADGQIHARFSSTREADLQSAPEGLTDPWLRTITFFDGTTPRVRLHYYASHPQSYYGDGRATADTVGLARESVEREEGVPQVYFTGCAGDITAGKYNDGSPQARSELTERMRLAMHGAIASTRSVEVREITWRTTEVQLELRTEPEWSDARSREQLQDGTASAAARLGAALNLAWRERVRQRPGIDLTRLTLGPVDILGLPAEAFVEFQLYAQSLRTNSFVAVAAYGESGPGYICTDDSLKQGGYEPTDARVGAPSELRLKSAIAMLLGPDLNSAQPPRYSDKLHLLRCRDAAGRERAVVQPSDWEPRRTQILESMQLVMGPLPDRNRRVPVQVETGSEEQLARFVRRRISFLAEPGDRVPAFLLIPRGLQGKAPAVLCLHQTTGQGKAEPAGLTGNTNLQYAAELAARGFVTLAPDYPGFGENKFDPYAAGYASATMKGIWNHIRAVDVLSEMPEVDSNRIGVIGHSLGGHNALFVAAFDPRLKAVVSSCGFNSFYAYAGGNLTGWSHRGYMPRISNVYDNDPGQVPFDFPEVLASLAPRPVFVSAPKGDDNFPYTGVVDCLVAARPVYELMGAGRTLVAEHPATGHEFPSETRAKAYAWLGEILK